MNIKNLVLLCHRVISIVVDYKVQYRFILPCHLCAFSWQPKLSTVANYHDPNNSEAFACRKTSEATILSTPPAIFTIYLHILNHLLINDICANNVILPTHKAWWWHCTVYQWYISHSECIIANEEVAHPQRSMWAVCEGQHYRYISR